MTATDTSRSAASATQAVQLFAGYALCQLVSVPRVPLPGEQDDGTEASFVSALAGANRYLLQPAGAGRGFAAMVVRPPGRTRFQVIIGGRDGIPLVPSATPSSQDLVLNFPPGARASGIEISEVAGTLGHFEHWVPVGARFHPPPEGTTPPTAEVTRRRFDTTFAYLNDPCAWVVLAQAVPADSRRDEQQRLALRIPRMRMSENSESDRVELSRAEARYRALHDAWLSGLWDVRVLVGGTNADAARRNAAVLAAAAPVDHLPYTLVAGEDVLDLAAAATSVWDSAPDGGAELPVSTTSTLVAALTRPPTRELPGLEVRTKAEFDVAPPPHRDGAIALGEVLDEGRRASEPFLISRETLNRHAFVAGATGAGKSQTVRTLLTELAHAHPPVPWLVIEPAKAEYARMRGRLRPDRNLVVIRPSDLMTAPAGLNPLEPAADFPLQSHIDLVRALFAAAFSADEPFPQILSQAMAKCYLDTGWGLITGRPIPVRAPGGTGYTAAQYPTLSDLQSAARSVVEAVGYGPEIAANVRGFVDVRIGSLRSGTPGRFFEGGHPLDLDALLAGHAVLELEDITNDDDKAFVIGTVIIRLVEMLRVKAKHAAPAGLRLVLVIEEAHRLLRRPEPGATGAAAAAVEMFASLLAEIRAYGVGVVVAEQIPSKIIEDVIKNSALKILHRLPAADDRAAIGATINLQQDQSEEVVALQPGQAVVATDGMDRPLLVQMPDREAQESPDDVDRYPPLAGRKSRLCGEPCQQRACTLGEIAAAEQLVEPALVVWIEAVTVATLTATEPPRPAPTLLGRLKDQSLRSATCAVAGQVDRSIDARRPGLRPLINCDDLRVIVLNCVYAGLGETNYPSLYGDPWWRWIAGPHRLDAIAGILATWGQDGRTEPWPVDPQWAVDGLNLDQPTLEDQVEQWRQHPWRADHFAAGILGDPQATGLLGAVQELTADTTIDHLARAIDDSCIDPSIDLIARFRTYWNSDPSEGARPGRRHHGQ